MIQPCALTDNKGKEGAYGTMSLSLHSCHKRYGSLLGQYYELSKKKKKTPHMLTQLDNVIAAWFKHSHAD